MSSVSFVDHLIQSPESELGRPPLEMLQLLMPVFWWSSEISIEASSVSKMPWKFLRKHRMPLNQVVQLLPLITCSFCRSWLGFTTNRSGFLKGDDLFVWWWYFGNVGNMSHMFAQCGFLLYGFLRFPTDSSLDDRGISTLRWRNIPMRKPHMRPGRPKFLTCGRNRFKVGPTLRHISVNRVTLTRVWGHWRKPIFHRGNMFSTRWDGCLSDCPTARKLVAQKQKATLVCCKALEAVEKFV